MAMSPAPVGWLASQEVFAGLLKPVGSRLSTWFTVDGVIPHKSSRLISVSVSRVACARLPSGSSQTKPPVAANGELLFPALALESMMNWPWEYTEVTKPNAPRMIAMILFIVSAARQRAVGTQIENNKQANGVNGLLFSSVVDDAFCG